MRRIAPAMGLVSALLLATLSALPGHAATGAHRTSSRSIGLDTHSTALGATFVSVSWQWLRSDTSYRVEISPMPDFSVVSTSRKVRSTASRPPGGRQATTIGHLTDGTYYYVRVRRTGASKSAWSPSVRVATRAHIPDKIYSANGEPGTEPGSTRLTWTTDGGYTDFFRITTATTPWGTANTPAQGRDSMTWRVPGTERSLTLSPEQTAAAGAPLGSGHQLLFRVTAVRSGEADSRLRAFPHIRNAPVTGSAPLTTGTALRFATYNVHASSVDEAGHLWADRAQRVANNIASHHPAIVALSEMLPTMWTSADGGPGLRTALQTAGAGQYQLTRETSYGVTSGDARILYDPTLVKMTSVCDPTVFSCAIKMPGPNGSVRVAAYARFQDLASGQEFWFASLHFDAGSDTATDALRGQQAQAVVEGMAAVNTGNLPVIIGGDYNSGQTTAGHDASHEALLQAGYYDTIAAAQTLNLQYCSVNHYLDDTPGAWGFGNMFDSIMTLGMPGAARFEQVLTGSPWPSDHNMVLADVQLP